MPHLSPMAWIYSLMIIWLTMMMMTSNMWWISPKSMKTLNNKKMFNNILMWKW
uniref:ATP synthase F0 subunit 8 n=1 Tax=Alboglossiphonia lata TaxID=321034 RepID=UPI0023D7F99C|nr:ATP synthase F0 subunit 8 [Alboglossiphonia lata]WDA96100.1 ATP synthase F0 subunit 8 [Alboglossiphonia lata]